MNIKKPIKITILILFVVLIILLLLPPLIFIVNSKFNNLDKAQFDNFEVEEIVKNNINYLLVSGRCNMDTCGSSLKIRRIKESKNNGDIYINVGITLFGEQSSSFLYPVALYKSVNRVLFGNEKKVIWERTNN